MPSLPVAGRRMVVGIADAGHRVYEVSVYVDGINRIRNLRSSVWDVINLAELLQVTVQLPPRSLNPDMYARLSALCSRYDIPVV